MLTNPQLQDFVRRRFRPQAELGRRFLTVAADDARQWALGYGGAFAPNGDPATSVFIEGRTDVPHEVTAADCVAFMALLARINAVITNEDINLIGKFASEPLTVG